MRELGNHSCLKGFVVMCQDSTLLMTTFTGALAAPSTWRMDSKLMHQCPGESNANQAQ